MAPGDQNHEAEGESKAILEFLRKKDGPYSEPLLISELFMITEEDEEIPMSQEEIVRLRKIKNVLRRLVEEKQIFRANLEDPETKEQVPHYSAKGWYATP